MALVRKLSTGDSINITLTGEKYAPYLDEHFKAHQYEPETQKALRYVFSHIKDATIDATTGQYTLGEGTNLSGLSEFSEALSKTKGAKKDKSTNATFYEKDNKVYVHPDNIVSHALELLKRAEQKHSKQSSGNKVKLYDWSEYIGQGTVSDIFNRKLETITDEAGREGLFRDTVKDIAQKYVQGAANNPDTNYFQLDIAQKLLNFYSGGDWNNFTTLAKEAGYDPILTALTKQDREGIAAQEKQDQLKANADKVEALRKKYKDMGMDPNLIGLDLETGELVGLVEQVQDWAPNGMESPDWFKHLIKDKEYRVFRHTNDNHFIFNKEGKLVDRATIKDYNYGGFDSYGRGFRQTGDRGVIITTPEENTKIFQEGFDFDALGIGNHRALKTKVHNPEYEGWDVLVNQRKGNFDELFLHKPGTSWNERVTITRDKSGKYRDKSGKEIKMDHFVGTGSGVRKELTSKKARFEFIHPEISTKSGKKLDVDKYLPRFSDRLVLEEGKEYYGNISNLPKEANTPEDHKKLVNDKIAELKQLGQYKNGQFTVASRNTEKGKFIETARHLLAYLYKYPLDIETNKTIEQLLEAANSAVGKLVTGKGDYETTAKHVSDILKNKKGGILFAKRGASAEDIQRRSADELYKQVHPEARTETDVPKKDLAGTWKDADAFTKTTSGISTAGLVASMIPGVGVIGGAVMTASDIAKGIHQGWSTEDTLNLFANLAFTGLALFGQGWIGASAKGAKAAATTGKSAIKLSEKAFVKAGESATKELLKKGSKEAGKAAVKEASASAKVLGAVGDGSKVTGEGIIKSLTELNKAALKVGNTAVTDVIKTSPEAVKTAQKVLVAAGTDATKITTLTESGELFNEAAKLVMSGALNLSGKNTLIHQTARTVGKSISSLKVPQFVKNIAPATGKGLTYAGIGYGAVSGYNIGKDWIQTGEFSQTQISDFQNLAMGAALTSFARADYIAKRALTRQTKITGTSPEISFKAGDVEIKGLKGEFKIPSQKEKVAIHKKVFGKEKATTALETANKTKMDNFKKSIADAYHAQTGKTITPESINVESIVQTGGDVAGRVLAKSPVFDERYQGNLERAKIDWERAKQIKETGMFRGRAYNETFLDEALKESSVTTKVETPKEAAKTASEATKKSVSRKKPNEILWSNKYTTEQKLEEARKQLSENKTLTKKGRESLTKRIKNWEKLLAKTPAKKEEGGVLKYQTPWVGGSMFNRSSMLYDMPGYESQKNYTNYLVSNYATIPKQQQQAVEQQAKNNGYEEWRKALPENLRDESPDYDLRGAYNAGMQPTLENGEYHLGSRDPKTGRILKKPTHPSFNQAINADIAMGYKVYKGPDGEIYTLNENPPEGYTPYEIQDKEQKEVPKTPEEIAAAAQAKVNSALGDIVFKQGREGFKDYLGRISPKMALNTVGYLDTKSKNIQTKNLAVKTIYDTINKHPYMPSMHIGYDIPQEVSIQPHLQTLATKVKKIATSTADFDKYASVVLEGGRQAGLTISKAQEADARQRRAVDQQNRQLAYETSKYNLGAQAKNLAEVNAAKLKHMGVMSDYYKSSTNNLSNYLKALNQSIDEFQQKKYFGDYSDTSANLQKLMQTDDYKEAIDEDAARTRFEDWKAGQGGTYTGTWETSAQKAQFDAKKKPWEHAVQELQRKMQAELYGSYGMGFGTYKSTPSYPGSLLFKKGGKLSAADRIEIETIKAVNKKRIKDAEILAKSILEANKSLQSSLFSIFK